MKVKIIGEKKGLPTFAAKVELSKKFAIPFTCLLFGLLGPPLGIFSSRGGKSGSFATSVAVILLYYSGLIFVQNMGKSGEMEPYSSVWVPNIILLFFVIYTSYKMQKNLPFNFLDRLVDNTTTIYNFLICLLKKPAPILTSDSQNKTLENKYAEKTKN